METAAFSECSCEKLKSAIQIAHCHREIEQFINPVLFIKNAGYMECNNMRELNVNELEEINGGFVSGLGWYLAGKLIDAALDADWGEASYEDMMIAP